MLNAQFSLIDDGTVVAELIARPSFLNRVLEAQKKDKKISTIISQIGDGKEIEFIVNENEVCIIKIGFVYSMIIIWGKPYLKRHIVDFFLSIQVAQRWIKI